MDASYNSEYPPQGTTWGVNGLTGIWHAVNLPPDEHLLSRAWRLDEARPLFDLDTNAGELAALIESLRKKCAEKTLLDARSRGAAMSAWVSALLALSPNVSHVLTVLESTGHLRTSTDELRDKLYAMLRSSVSADSADPTRTVFEWLKETCGSSWTPTPNSILESLTEGRETLHDVFLGRLNHAEAPDLRILGHSLAETPRDAVARLAGARTIAWSKAGCIHLVFDIVAFLQDLELETDLEKRRISLLEILLAQQLLDLILVETTDLPRQIRQTVVQTLIKSLGGGRLQGAATAFFARWEGESDSTIQQDPKTSTAHETGNLWEGTLRHIVNAPRAAGSREPTSDRRAAGAALPKQPEVSPRVARKTVLVVDDARLVRRQVTQAVANLGHDYFEAANGHEALKIALRRKPDLIILDLYMEEMNGFEMLRELRENPLLKETLVLVLTVTGNPMDIQEAQSHGIVDYLVKPIDSARLNKKIAGFLGQ